MMKNLVFLGVLVFALNANAQDVALREAASNDGKDESTSPQKVVVVTGVRFSYKLIQQWIDDFNKVNPDIQIVIEARGSTDPSSYDILAEVYEHDDSLRESRDYLHVGRYAILPVANAKSEFAEMYSKKGLTTELIKQIYFHDKFADHENQARVKAPFTVYTRLQKAGVPIVFSKYFGFHQKDIVGKGIAGSDEHLLKALLRDTTALSYLPAPVLYDHQLNQPIDGLVVLPVDLDGNGRLSDDEKILNDETRVIQYLEAQPVENVPVEYLHLSVDKKKASPEAMEFLKWVSANGNKYLNDFGYLKPEAGRFNEFTSRARIGNK